MSGGTSSAGAASPDRSRSLHRRTRRASLHFLAARVAAQQRAGGSWRLVLRRCGRAFGLALVAALLALPLALTWGIAHASVSDYLGPHRSVFSANFSGEAEVELGPLGNAFLPSPVAPIGVDIAVGGVGGTSTGTGFFSEQTLTAYTALYADPQEAVGGVMERLAERAITIAFVAELALLIIVAGWLLRRRLLAPALVSQISRRRMIVVWLSVTVLVIGSILAPKPAPTESRTPVLLDYGGRTHHLQVDSVLLADLLDRGIKGVTLLAQRQQQAVDDYVNQAAASLGGQVAALPAPGPGETMIFGFSDLHCNQAMTTLIGRLVMATRPALVISAGDDTVNGTAAERGCIKSEAGIAAGVPMLDSPGNHDSDVTEDQLKSAGVTVLNGATVTVEQARNITVLGDDDPEHNIPFSVDRVNDRPETEDQLGRRLLETGRNKPVDVLSVHQPTAADIVMSAANPPARLVMWGHMHSQIGPVVVGHADGSWTVGMQQGTAGGVKQPTISSFSTPFSPPLITADVYFYFRDDATGLITGVQPVHFQADAHVVISRRVATGRLDLLPEGTRLKLTGATPAPTPDQGR